MNLSIVLKVVKVPGCYTGFLLGAEFCPRSINVLAAVLLAGVVKTVRC